MNKLVMNCPNSTRFDSSTKFNLVPIDDLIALYRNELPVSERSLPDCVSVLYKHDSGLYTTTYKDVVERQKRNVVDFLVDEEIINVEENSIGMLVYSRGQNYERYVK